MVCPTGRGATHPCRLLSEFLRWFLCSSHVIAAAMNPAAAVTVLQLAFAPLQQQLSRKTGAAVPPSIAEEATAQQRVVAGVLWSICQAWASCAAIVTGITVYCSANALREHLTFICNLSASGSLQFGQPELAAVGWTYV